MIAYRIEMTATGRIYGRARKLDSTIVATTLSVSGMFGQGLPTPECVGMCATHLWCEDRNIPTVEAASEKEKSDANL